MKEIYDVVIIGGGPAGLSAALTLARANKKTIVFDEGKGRNAPAAHMMNFPSRDGTPPEEFKNQIKEDLKKYPHISFRKEKITQAIKHEGGFLLNNEIKCKKIILAYGVKDILPPISGINELWGKSIHHCPYCHGIEYTGGKIGILGNEEAAKHYAILLKSFTNDIIYFSNGENVTLIEDFKRNHISVITEKIDSIIQKDELLAGVKMMSGKMIQRDCLFVRPLQEIINIMGCEMDENGFIKTDFMGMTTVPGIYAAGDIATPMQSVVMACASGSKAGAASNFAIMSEIF